MNSNPYGEKSSLLLPGLYAAVLSFFLSAAGPARVAAEPLAAGMDHSISIDSTGKMWLWGDNSKGQLASEDLDNRFLPFPFRDSTDWLMVTAGNHHTVALCNDGTLWSVGSNENGQVGLGLVLDPSDPSTAVVDILTQIGTDTDWMAVSAGGQHTLALKTNGSLWAWGSNTLGQVGNGTTDDAIISPIQVGTATDWSAISAGGFHSLAIRQSGGGQSGTFWSWGSNLNDELGIIGIIGNFFLLAPAQVGIDADWSTISAGGTHSLAIKSSGTLWAWVT